MSSTRSRLKKLEALHGPPQGQRKLIVVDGTREEVERQITDAKSELNPENGDILMAVVPTPYLGESMNEARKSKGLEPLDIPGWDEPRAG